MSIISSLQKKNVVLLYLRPESTTNYHVSLANECKFIARQNKYWKTKNSDLPIRAWSIRAYNFHSEMVRK